MIMKCRLFVSTLLGTFLSFFSNGHAAPMELHVATFDLTVNSLPVADPYFPFPLDTPTIDLVLASQHLGTGRNFPHGLDENYAYFPYDRKKRSVEVEDEPAVTNSVEFSQMDNATVQETVSSPKPASEAVTTRVSLSPMKDTAAEKSSITEVSVTASTKSESVHPPNGTILDRSINSDSQLTTTTVQSPEGNHNVKVESAKVELPPSYPIIDLLSDFPLTGTSTDDAAPLVKPPSTGEGGEMLHGGCGCRNHQHGPNGAHITEGSATVVAKQEPQSNPPPSTKESTDDDLGAPTSTTLAHA